MPKIVPHSAVILSAIFVLSACEPMKNVVDDLRRANPYSEVNDPDAENRRLQSSPQCWWDQPYETVCERARAGGGNVCRPVPIGQPIMRCVGAGPQFPYSQNRR